MVRYRGPAVSHWTRWWVRNQKWAEHQVASEHVKKVGRGRQSLNASIHGGKMRRNSSEENNFGSPTGGRASSIASNRESRGSRRSFGSNSPFQHDEETRAAHDWLILKRAERRRAAVQEAVDQLEKFQAIDHLKNVSSRDLDEMLSIKSFQLVDEELQWVTNALARPRHEPPVLDYRKFDEGGAMYHSLHRHPDTHPEHWYEYTDAEIETELLGDYSDWLFEARQEASEAGHEEWKAFYDELSREVDQDRARTTDEFAEIIERRYAGRKEGRAGIVAGRRVQQQFDEVRKVWREVESVNSEWDEREWEIFGGNQDQRRGKGEGSQVSITESNLLRLDQIGNSSSSLGTTSYAGTGLGRPSEGQAHTILVDSADVESLSAGIPPSPSSGIKPRKSEKGDTLHFKVKSTATTPTPGGAVSWFTCCFG